jgi:ribosomal protein S20
MNFRINKKSQENNDALPVQVRTPQQEIDNQKAQDTKAKTDALKKLHDELDKTTKEGLLDAPAVVRLDPLLVNEGPVFLPESEGCTLLATENPNYFRKDLPKYVPQFFILEVIVTDTKSRFMNFKRIIDDNFPIEKLKAIIDK